MLAPGASAPGQLQRRPAAPNIGDAERLASLAGGILCPSVSTWCGATATGTPRSWTTGYRMFRDKRDACVKVVRAP